MDDGISIPAPPAGHDYRVQLTHIGLTCVPQACQLGRRSRSLVIHRARCAEKARLQALASVGAGWRVVEVRSLGG